MHLSSVTDKEYQVAKIISLLKHFQAVNIRMDYSEKKEQSTNNLRFLESSTKEVASIYVQ